jgi:hypothetical protein
MDTPHSARIRFGVLALPIQSVLGIASVLIRGPFIDPAANPAGFAQAATSRFFLAAMLGTAGVMLLSLSFLALYAYLADGTSERPAFFGMLFSLIGGWFTLPLIGLFGFALPSVGQLYLQGQSNVLQVAITAAGPPFLAFALLSGIGSTIGAILFGVAFWRKGSLPRWVVIVYVVSIPMFYFAPPVPFVVELLGMVFLLVAGSFIAYQIWQRSPSTK